MSKLMRTIVLLILLSISFVSHSQMTFFPTEVMRKVYISIYKHVKLYYPQAEIEVSYYFEDETFPLFAALDKMYGKRHIRVGTNILERSISVSRQDEYSELLYEIFEPINKDNSNTTYELWFTYSEYDMIACTLYPKGTRDSIFGSLEGFAFGFSPNGDIDFMTHSTIHRN